MRIHEIMIQDMREEKPESYILHFLKSITYTQQLPYHMHNMMPEDRLEFKLVDDTYFLHLGIFSANQIIAYLSLHQFLDSYQVDLTVTDPAYRNQGLIRWMIEFATARYKKIYSDSRHTESERTVWTALIKNPNNSEYFWINIDTDEIIPVEYDRSTNQISSDPWDDTDEVLIMATPKNHSPAVKKMLQERNAFDLLRCRPARLLGPGFKFPNP